MKQWEKDKAWSDRYLPAMKRILGEHLIGEAPLEEDIHRNTDLIVLRMQAVRIGCRVRRHDYLAQYGNEFTIRCARDNAKTELTKILEGWGDFFFYGFAADAGQTLSKWTILDLSQFRLWFSRRLYKMQPNEMPGKLLRNHDGSSDFRVFRWDALPKPAIIASSHDNLDR